jgi:hypothetical protein
MPTRTALRCELTDGLLRVAGTTETGALERIIGSRGRKKLETVTVAYDDTGVLAFDFDNSRIWHKNSPAAGYGRGP